MNAGWIALLISLAVAAGGLAAQRCADVPWAGVLYYVGLSAFVGCFTNKLAIRALFDPWPSRRWPLPGTGVIRRKAAEIGREVARAVSEKVMPPEVFQERTIAALEAAIGSGVLDSRDVYFKVRKVIEEAGGVAGRVGDLTGFADYDVLTHRAIDFVKETLRAELNRPDGLVADLVAEGAKALDIEGIVRQRLEEFGPGGLRDLAYDLAGRHLVWLEVWGAVFGGAAGVLAWLMVRT